MKVAYIEKRFRQGTLELIDGANAIIEEYQRGGYVLTLRQLYYQFVSRDLLANTEQNYARLGRVLSDGRLAGLVDWEAIEDRTRETVIPTRWGSPREIAEAAARSYHIDLWENQPVRVEIWVEKDALAGVFERVCRELDVPLLACRGYTSQSEMWSSAQRMTEADAHHVILHFGDHDPSGIDMTRDIEERLINTFGAPAEVIRIALNMDQIEEYNPPPNPAKSTDSRFESYMQEFGDESWELDALEPQVLEDLAGGYTRSYIDAEQWGADRRRQEQERSRLFELAKKV
jgi:hypothetical protein